MLKRLKDYDIFSFFLSAVSGLMLSLSFPKADLSWLAWFAIIPFLAAIKNSSGKKSAIIGGVFGLTHFLTLLYWLVYTLNTYGYLPVILCVPILFLLTFYLSLYPAFFSWFLTRFCKSPSMLIILGPSLWVCLESLRAIALTGFPWELLGYSQHNLITMIQIADITGVYGISFLIVLVNISLFLTYLFFSKQTWQGKAIGAPVAVSSTAFTILLVLLAAVYGTYRIKSIDSASTKADTANVSVLQGNIDQSLKWNTSYQVTTLKKYNRLSDLSSDGSTDLIVWPETAAPFYYLHNTPLTDFLNNSIKKTNTTHIIGSPSFIKKDNRFMFYNTAYLMSPEATVTGKYDKVHLVPFGEYVPLQKYLPFINKLTEQAGNFYSGKKGTTLNVNHLKAGVQICFEIIFPNLSRASVQNGATLIVNMTNDAWFGRTSAPYQHFSMVKFRAIENRRTVARAANTGISGFIDPVGRVVSSTNLFEETYLSESVPLLTHLTFYTRYGDLFVIVCIVLLLSSTAVSRRLQGFSI